VNQPPSRRTFIKGASLLGAGSLASCIVSPAQLGLKDQSGAVNWEAVRSAFPITQWNKIHLNSGSAGVLPTSTSEALIELIRYAARKAPYVIWDEWQEIKQSNTLRLASLVGADKTELQVVRNTTEALNMIIAGLELEQGDEVIYTRNAYPFAINAWNRKAEKEGLIIKELDYVLPLSDEEILQQFRDAISDRTKVIHVSHITHHQGHVMPVNELTRLAHEAGAEIVVDGAHVVGHIAVDLHDIGCDYFATSLHKWLNAPLGTGLLFVREDKIPTLGAHLSSYEKANASMDKYEHLGTRCWANEIGITAALDFHDELGPQVKQDRLQYLKEYWMDSIAQVDRVNLYTDKAKSCAVAAFGIDGLKAHQLLKALDEEFDIHAKPINLKLGKAIRISPNIFTSEKELDQLVEATSQIIKRF